MAVLTSRPSLSLSKLSSSSYSYSPSSARVTKRQTNPHNLVHLRQSSSSGRVVSSQSRKWRNTSIGDFVSQGGEEEVDSDEDPDDRSLDLLLRFLQNVFRKLSKRTRKSLRSVLPVSISTELVGFFVNGVIILAFLWILEAFLLVVATVGILVFVSILLIRGIWSGVSYLQESRRNNANDFDDQAWSNVQPDS